MQKDSRGFFVSGKGGLNCSIGAPLVNTTQPNVRSNRRWRLEEKKKNE
jgi:hypothetical protein